MDPEIDVAGFKSGVCQRLVQSSVSHFIPSGCQISAFEMWLTKLFFCLLSAQPATRWAGATPDQVQLKCLTEQGCCFVQTLVVVFFFLVGFGFFLMKH